MGVVLVEWTDHYNHSPAISPYASNVTRTWVRNEIGTASMALPLTAPNLASLIRWGRIIRIHEAGVPTWAGVVTEREWAEDGVTLRLKSAEWLLSKALTGQGLAFPTGSSSGAIAYGLFSSAYVRNRIAKPLRAGIFGVPNPRFKEPYNYADCWEELKRLAEEDGADVWVDANLYCHYSTGRGRDKTATVKLRSGKHLINLRIGEGIEDALTGTVALGAGPSLSSQLKTITRWSADPGYERLEVLKFDKTNDLSDLNSLAQQAIRERAYPKTIIDCEFVKVPGGEHWGAFGISDIVELIVPSYLDGFGGVNPTMQARVLGMELGGEDQMRLVLGALPATDLGMQFSNWNPT